MFCKSEWMFSIVPFFFYFIDFSVPSRTVLRIYGLQVVCYSMTLHHKGKTTADIYIFKLLDEIINSFVIQFKSESLQ